MATNHQTYADTALLVMDVQKHTIKSLKDPNYYIHGIARAIAGARKAGIPVMYVVVGFRAGYPEVHPDNLAFSNIKNTNVGLDDAANYAIPDAIAPKAEDLVLIKKRFSAFAGSGLDLILRARQIRHLVMAGISTSGVVLSTLREASDKDFKITVLADGCSDRDDTVHQVLMERVFPRQSLIITIDDWLSLL
ncbi:Nicotinamidase-related amidase [Arachidicoccus rhizosphaerae]|jgi:nicotinamidase-related amidase|uniref:Nicotinamidase-related amidase n=1 Tax=Arachidicoccus rhizosphaerae TaxID=551991 RepID=A0A1H3VHE3_9BACT|nr:isochorismatase family cysteine hydrolase [Arachidicoccus rhizosphaerae]SDZ74215.1 Nicotinamidase-related amidase [Arachidicoccus rhizosphaerae]